jgi:hypothetical protein
MRSGFGWIVIGSVLVGLFCGFLWGYCDNYFHRIPYGALADDDLFPPGAEGLMEAIPGGIIGLIAGCILAALLALWGWLQRQEPPT